MHLTSFLLAAHPRPVRQAIERHRRALDANPVEYLHANEARLTGRVRATAGRFAETMAAVDIGIVGWPGDRDDPAVSGIREVTHRLGKLVVVTQGSQEVRVFDGRPGGLGDIAVAVLPVPVLGTTVGCGDAFVAGFLGEWRRSRDVLAAVEAGKRLGATATAWRRPLPDEAYGPEAVAALRAADRAAGLGARARAT